MSTLREIVVDTVREALVVLDGDLRVISAGRPFYQTFSATADETEGHLILWPGRQAVEHPQAVGAPGV